MVRTAIASLALAAGLATAAPHEEMEILEPLHGDWVVEAAWIGGGEMWGVTRWKPVLSGSWLRGETYVREAGPDGESRLYHRYTSMIGWDRERETHVAWSFANGGEVASEDFQVTSTDGGLSMFVEFDMDGTLVRDQSFLHTAGTDAGVMDWDVSIQQNGAWVAVMDDAWEPAGDGVFDAAVEAVGPVTLSDAVGALRVFEGVWDIDAEWAMGGTLQGTQTNTPGVGGDFLVSAVQVSDNGGPTYDRYHTFWAKGSSPKSSMMYTFQYDGTLVIAEAHGEAVDGAEVWTVVNDNPGAPFDLKQTLDLAEPGAMQWTVEARPKGQDQWNTMMDAAWLKAGN